MNFNDELTIFFSKGLIHNNQPLAKTQLFMPSEDKEQKRLGHKFIIAMWVALMIMVYFLFAELLEHDYNPNQQPQTESGTKKIVILEQNRYGHYVSNGEINNHSVTFLLDTGASDISIPEKVAKKLKLHYGQKRRYQTANGIIVGYATMLDEVSIGKIKLHNVRASINPKMKGNEILMGMSFLKFIEFTQRGNTLILRQE